MDPQIKVIYNPDGNPFEGRNEMTTRDFMTLHEEIARESSALATRLMAHIESVRMPEKQELELKQFVKEQIWERSNDLMGNIFRFKNEHEMLPKEEPLNGTPRYDNGHP